MRRIAALTANLPDGSRVWVVTDHDRAWTTTDYLLAASVDRARTDEKQKPVPRPADARERRHQIDVASARADAQMARQRATNPQ